LHKSLVIAARVALAACLLITARFAFAAPASGAHLFPWDKADHFSAFFAIMATSIVAFPRVRILWIAMAVSALGGLIELIQGLPTVNRDCDIWDWMAENAAIAAVIGIVIASEIRRRAKAGSLSETQEPQGATQPNGVIDDFFGRPITDTAKRAPAPGWASDEHG
jgi:hypothetical protein